MEEDHVVTEFEASNIKLENVENVENVQFINAFQFHSYDSIWTKLFSHFSFENRIFQFPPMKQINIWLSVRGVNGFFTKWNRNSVNSANSRNLINHSSMNNSQFKDPVSHICLAGNVVASWSLIQEVAGIIVMTNIFVTEFNELSKNI